MKLGNKHIGVGYPTVVIAEAGCNHNQDLELALGLVSMAARAQADFVKFQTYYGWEMYSRYTPMMSHFSKYMDLGPNPSMLDLITATELPESFYEPILENCRVEDITFMSTPFSERAVDFLENFNLPFYKIASFEITHIPLIARAAQTGRPIVLSTGMSDLRDVETAISVLEENGCKEYALLHCVSNYPTAWEDCNLKAIETLRSAFGCPVGLSDHTPGIEVALMAMGIGIDLLEKHITLDRSLPGPDHNFSLIESELEQLCRLAKHSSVIMGTGVKSCTLAEHTMKEIGRRSVMAACDLRKGHRLTMDDVVVKRPGEGLHPSEVNEYLGARLTRDIKMDMPLTREYFLDKLID